MNIINTKEYFAKNKLIIREIKNNWYMDDVFKNCSGYGYHGKPSICFWLSEKSIFHGILWIYLNDWSFGGDIDIIIDSIL